MTYTLGYSLMTQQKKIDYRLNEENNQWTVEITRRVSRAKVIVSKSQGGFDSEQSATVWAESQMQDFISALKERNMRHADRRDQRTEQQDDAE